MKVLVHFCGCDSKDRLIAKVLQCSLALLYLVLMGLLLVLLVLPDWVEGVS